MKLAILLLTLSMLIMFVGCQKSASRSSLDALGTLKSGVDAVAVYYPHKAEKKFVKSEKRFIKPNAQVFTVDDEQTKAPRLHAVVARSKSGETLKLKLVEVVFKNPNEKDWFYGLVLDKCFDWDNSKSLDIGVMKNANSISNDDSSSDTTQSVKTSTSKNICKL